MGIFQRKQEQKPSREYSAWCELVMLLSRPELERLEQIESRWKEGGNKISGRFNLEHYLTIIQYKQKNEKRQ